MFSGSKESGIWIVAILIIIAGLGLGFLVSTGLYWIVCWAFGLVFSWKIAVGVWVIYMIVSSMIGRK